uniref:Uncharacterized protein n=1 Tax=Rhizophora mucronata TaxID=61149 RepID=A0A2P2KS13_RHIMU
MFVIYKYIYFIKWLILNGNLKWLIDYECCFLQLRLFCSGHNYFPQILLTVLKWFG